MWVYMYMYMYMHIDVYRVHTDILSDKKRGLR